MHRSLLLSSWLLLVPFVSVPVLLAQAPPVHPAAAAGGTFAAPHADGAVHGGGPDYRVCFNRGSVAFTPALGREADREWPVRFTFASVRRGAEPVFVGPTATLPIAAGTQVRYPHTPTLTEVYDLRDDGIEQSFVFTERPAGHGDLVVRGRIATDLPLAAAHDAGVRYERAGLGGVAFGAVTGIDAAGATVRGSIRVLGDAVEWVLPASFVDGATYPLVLDPLIGSVLSIGNEAGGDDVLPSVAYDESNDRYLVVWNVVLTSTVAEVRGRFVSGGGAAIGSSFVVESNGAATVRPTVVNVAASNRFLVGWRRYAITLLPTPSVDQDWYVRAVTASDGSMSAPLLVAVGGGAGATTEVVLAGDRRSAASGSNQDALLLRRVTPWQLQPLPRIYARSIDVPVTGDPTLNTEHLVFELPGDVGNLVVTGNGGSAGRWLAAFGWTPTPGQPFASTRALLLDENGAVCQSLGLLTGVPSTAPVALATKDGVHFALAWEDDVTLGVLLRTLTASGTCGSVAASFGAIVDPTGAGLDGQPALDFARDEYVLAWRRSFLLGSPSRVFVRGLDPDTCATCGSEWSVDTTLIDQTTPALASRWGGGGTGSDEVLVVWSNTTVRGRRFEATGTPPVVNVGGSCGAGGTVGHQGQPVLGDATFALSLAAPTAPVLAAIVGLSNLSIPCGPCVLVPNTDIVLAGPGPHPIPIPCDTTWLGVQFWAQWLLLAPGGCAILPDFALSDAQRFTIGE